MPGLATLIRNKFPTVETNLEQGEIWLYSPGTERSNFPLGFCWRATASGTAIIEAWGAGGSGSRMCCCGGGLPGNSGGYSKKTITVTSGCYVCGVIGQSPTSDSLCFAGCGNATQLCWFGSNTNGCICARGGMGSTSFCTTGASMYCCFGANGWPTTQCSGANCGLVCNAPTGYWQACAYGGDVNCTGNISCTAFLGCQANCQCFFTYHLATPPGIFSTQGAIVTYQTDSDGGEGINWAGTQLNSVFTALSAASKAPKMGQPFRHCWSSGVPCGCQDQQAYLPSMPIGAGGLPPTPCTNVRDVGVRGGWGAVRIKFIQS